jgi:hypothetical protein
MRKDCLHDGLLGLKSEIEIGDTWLNSDTEAQIGVAGKRSLNDPEIVSHGLQPIDWLAWLQTPGQCAVTPNAILLHGTVF